MRLVTVSSELVSFPESENSGLSASEILIVCCLLSGPSWVLVLLINNSRQASFSFCFSVRFEKIVNVVILVLWFSFSFKT